jgi:hypothetical protein
MAQMRTTRAASGDSSAKDKVMQPDPVDASASELRTSAASTVLGEPSQTVPIFVCLAFSVRTFSTPT